MLTTSSQAKTKQFTCAREKWWAEVCLTQSAGVLRTLLVPWQNKNCPVSTCTISRILDLIVFSVQLVSLGSDSSQEEEMAWKLLLDLWEADGKQNRVLLCTLLYYFLFLFFFPQDKLVPRRKTPVWIHRCTSDPRIQSMPLEGCDFSREMRHQLQQRYLKV